MVRLALPLCILSTKYKVSSSPLHLLNPTFSEGISTVTSDLRLLKQISDPAQRHLCYGTHKKKRCGGTSPKLSHQVTRPYPLEAAQHPVVDASLGVALCWRSGCQRKQGVCWSQWLSEQMWHCLWYHCFWSSKRKSSMKHNRLHTKGYSRFWINSTVRKGCRKSLWKARCHLLRPAVHRV